MALSVARIAGFSFLRSWMGVLFFSSSLFMAYNPAMRWEVENSVFVSSLIALTISLFACALLHRTVMGALNSRYGFLAGPTFTAVGVLLLLPSLHGGTAIEPAVLGASAVLTGFGSCLVLLDVGRSYASTQRRTCLVEVLLGTAIGSLLPLAASLLPVDAGCIAAVAMMLAAGICAHEANLSSKDEPRGNRVLGEVLPATTLGRLISGAFVLGFATGLIRYLYSPTTETASFNESAIWFFVFSAVVCLALVIPAARSRQCSMTPYYRLVIVLCTAGFALVPVFEMSSALPHLIFTVGYALFEVLAWVIMAELAHRFQYTSVQVFGIGRILVVEIGVIAGVVLFPSLGVQGVEARLLVTISVVSVILITVVSHYVLRAQDIPQLEDVPGSARSEAEGSAVEGSREVAGESRGAADAARLAPREDGNTGAPAFKGSPRIPLLERCRIVGAYYGLTEREVDVMHLFATGRTAARVQEELVISAGTVNTHAMHIYQKMDIHSRQELMELVATANLDEMTREASHGER